MHSLADLNTYGSTTLDLSDQRPAGVVFDRVAPLNAVDQSININSILVFPTPSLNITEIINYQIANVRYRVQIIPGPDNPLTGSSIYFSDIPSHVTLTTGVNEFVLSGLQTVDDWERVKNFSWILPANYSSKPLWYLNVSVIYFDQTQNSDVSRSWFVYDPRFFYVSKITASTNMQVVANRKSSNHIAMNAAFTLREFGLEWIVSFSTICNASKRVKTSANLSMQSTLLTASSTIIKEIKKITVNSYGTSAGDAVGTSVATYNNYILIGAPGEDTGSYTNVGRTYLYQVSEAGFSSLVSSINPPAEDAKSNFGFGNSVAMSSAYLAIGNRDTEFAKVHYYMTNPLPGFTYLNHTSEISSAGTISNSSSLALSSEYLVVGYPYRDSLNNVESGLSLIAHIPSPSSEQYLINPNVNVNRPYDHFGFSVAISGNYVVVGAPNKEPDSTGIVYIYSAATGQLLRTINDPNYLGNPNNDLFGYSVAADGNYLVIGAPGEDSESGVVYVYDLITGDLIRTFTNPNATAGDQFGYSVDVSSDLVLVGAPYTDGSVTNAGAAYIFSFISGSLLKTISDNTLTSAAQIGGSVAITDSLAVVGAPGETISSITNAGAVRYCQIVKG